MGMRSPQSNWLRWLTLYLLIGLAILLFAVNLFPPFTTRGASQNTPTVTTGGNHNTKPTKTVTSTKTATPTKTATSTTTAQSSFTPLVGPLPVQLQITDPQGLSNGTDSKAASSISSQVTAQIQDKTVALVIIYVAVLNIQQPSDGQNLVKSLVSILKTEPGFANAIYRSVIYSGSVTTSVTPSGVDIISAPSPLMSRVDLRVYVF